MSRDTRPSLAQAIIQKKRKPSIGDTRAYPNKSRRIPLSYKPPIQSKLSIQKIWRSI
jgi:hypothetical protein